MTTNNYNYPGIVAWHASSMKYYTDALVALAQKTDAPKNAVYAEKDNDGNLVKWHTTDDVTDYETRADMARVREALA